MNDSSAPYYNPGPYGIRPARPSPYRWVAIAAIGIAVVIAIAVIVWYLVLPHPSGGYYYYPLGGFFLVFIVIWVSFMIVRMSWWSSRRNQRYNRRQMYRQGGGMGPMGDPAIRTARMRYARGEITRDQYEQIVHDIGGRPPAP